MRSKPVAMVANPLQILTDPYYVATDHANLIDYDVRIELIATTSELPLQRKAGILVEMRSCEGLGLIYSRVEDCLCKKQPSSFTIAYPA